MSVMNHMSMHALSQNQKRNPEQLIRSSASAPRPHIDSTMSCSKAISSGTAMPQ